MSAQTDSNGLLKLVCRINPEHKRPATDEDTLLGESTVQRQSNTKISELAIISPHDNTTYKHATTEKCLKCGLQHNFVTKIIQESGLTIVVNECEGAFYADYKKMEANIMAKTERKEAKK